MNAYTPAGLGALFVANAPGVLIWVGVAVSAAIALMLVYKGIRAGVWFFQIIALERHSAANGFYLDAGEIGDDDDGKHAGWIDTSGYDMGMEAPDVGTRPGK